MKQAHILIIDDEESIRHTFGEFLRREGYRTSAARDYADAMAALQDTSFDLVFTDIILGEHSGVDILKEIKAQGRTCPVIMMTGEPNIDTAAASVRLGAFDYLPKPIKRDTLVRVTKHALQHKMLLDEKAVIENEKDRYQSHLEAIFRSVEDAIITVDSDLRIIQANDAVEKICDLAPKVITNARIDTIENECCKECMNILKETLQTKRSIHEYRIECSNTKHAQQVVVLNISPLRDRQDKQIGAVMIIRDITRLSHLEKELQDRHQFHNIIGRSKKMQDIYNLLEDLKDVDTTVLITGQSGTGKELIARAVHYNSVRSANPFVVVNCSALAENLLESELFGHVKGAFTGAIKDKAGRFQLAGDGTIFLDEIGDISPRTQLKLLRVLEAREFERVGDSTPISMDAQVISATNRDLKERVRTGEFREDLYYRLKVVEISMPPLSERKDDITLLVNHYIQEFNNRFNKHIMGVSSRVEKIFMEYDWPGNIRELLHTLEHAFVVCRRPTIEEDDLPPEFRNLGKYQPERQSPVKSGRQDIIDALEKTYWNKAKAADILNISRQTLYRKMKEYNIRNQDKKV
ncbi:MAG: sigma-54-dependent Fis family transcriptional regulator [Deltaproteobacteria bacterium]|nr:sigma-54-dependent Fis family transcriptional regulator [Deltaproteobacteria bacterium]